MFLFYYKEKDRQWILGFTGEIWSNTPDGMSAGCISHVHLGRSLEETSAQGEDRSKIKLGRWRTEPSVMPVLSRPSRFLQHRSESWHVSRPLVSRCSASRDACQKGQRGRSSALFFQWGNVAPFVKNITRPWFWPHPSPHWLDKTLTDIAPLELLKAGLGQFTLEISWPLQRQTSQAECNLMPL